MDFYEKILAPFFALFTVAGWIEILPNILQIISLMIGIAVGVTWLILNRQQYLIRKRKLDEKPN